MRRVKVVGRGDRFSSFPVSGSSVYGGAHISMKYIFAIALSVFLISLQALAEEPSPDGVDPEVREDGDGIIRNGCIANMGIRNVKFTSGSTGVIEVQGNHKLLLTLKRPCPGIRSEGYVHKPINNRFCEGDMLRVINYGNVCIVDTIRPYVAMEAVDGAAEPADK